ncbi:MAG: hypothetical protein JOS17DRAFT_49903 [Linnemannia elongata]|nr:MAG: hypothetical protein JOS17DRAFT_49903 [Linnemannia elongata]
MSAFLCKQRVQKATHLFFFSFLSFLSFLSTLPRPLKFNKVSKPLRASLSTCLHFHPSLPPFSSHHSFVHSPSCFPYTVDLLPPNPASIFYATRPKHCLLLYILSESCNDARRGVSFRSWKRLPRVRLAEMYKSAFFVIDDKYTRYSALSPTC